MRALRKRSGSDGGFTLIELLVVIVILGILIAIAVPTFLNQQSSANDASAKTALDTAYHSAAAEAASNKVAIGEYPDAATLASDITKSEPELTVTTSANPNQATTPGTVYITTTGTPGSNGNFQAAALSKSGNICTLTVTNHSAPSVSCAAPPTAPTLTSWHIATANPPTTVGLDPSRAGAYFGSSTTSCSAGQNMLGGGYSLSNTTSPMYPLENDPVTVSSRAAGVITATAGTQVTANGICVTAPAGYNPPVQGVPVSTSTSVPTVTATASCSSLPGTVVAGGGYHLGNSQANYYASLLTQDRATDATTWSVTMTQSNSASPVQFSAFAVCIPAPDGYEQQSGPVSAPGASTGSSTAQCQTTGDKVISGGFQAVAGSNYLSWVTSSLPSADGSSWTIQDHFSVTTQTVQAYAICAKATT